MRILLLEDDPLIGDAVAADLTGQGYRVRQCRDLAEAKRALEKPPFELFLLDVHLPDGACFELCRELAADYPGTPILVMTAATDEATALRSLALGALDFIRKPFNRQELLLKIKNHLRDRRGVLQYGGLLLDLDRRHVEYEGKAIPVLGREVEILALLLRRPGDLLTRDAILRAIDPSAELEGQTLNSYVSRLRHKLEAASGGTVRLQPVYGQGYRLLFPEKREGEPSGAAKKKAG